MFEHRLQIAIKQTRLAIAENEGKVQSKESSPCGKSPNDDSAWEDLPNENDPAVVEPVPKSTKRVKKSVLNKLRAISTPNKNESHLQANVTFMDRSEIADISAIPVLSPPTGKIKFSFYKYKNIEF